jgi:hypothetical protein
MGKNNSVNGEVMFKFDASKYDIKDGNVTFWIWSPDIPSLGSVPIPANSTQGSAQSQIGNLPSSSTDYYHYRSWHKKEKLPYITVNVTKIEPFLVGIKVKLLDSKDNPMPNKKLKIILKVDGGEDTIPIEKISSRRVLFRQEFKWETTVKDLYTNDNGEVNFCPIINIPPYIKFATLYIEVYLDEEYKPPGLLIPISSKKISSSLKVYLGKRVTLLINVEKILKNENYIKNFTRIQEGEPKIETEVLVTTYKYTAIVGPTTFVVQKKPYVGYIIRETINPSIGIGFKLKIGPNHTRHTMDEWGFNFIMDLENRKDRSAKFIDIYDERLKKDLMYPDLINNENLMRKIMDNIGHRVRFKREWQMSYPAQLNLEIVKKTYMDYFLDPKEAVIFPQPFRVDIVADGAMPASLYIITLITGDYRYILMAILGSIFTITSSLALGLNETKAIRKSELQKSEENEGYLYSILIGIAIGVILTIFGAGAPLLVQLIASAIGVAVGTGYTYLITQKMTKPKYNYLLANMYSPRYLLSLIKIIEWDLTLLNYEINIWDQLRD